MSNSDIGRFVARACALDFGIVWDDQLHLIEFSYGNSYYVSINMVPLRRCTEENVDRLLHRLILGMVI